MKKVLLLLAEGFEIYEASVFIDVFGWNLIYGTKNIELLSCGLTKNIKSAFGLRMSVDCLASEVDVNDFEALALPGGFEDYGYYKDAFSTSFQDMIRSFNEVQKPIASICVGALPLAKSGILTTRKATTYNLLGNNRKEQLKDLGSDFVDQAIVKDGNVITSCGPYTAVDVAFMLLEELSSSENADYIRNIMGFRK